MDRFADPLTPPCHVKRASPHRTVLSAPASLQQAEDSSNAAQCNGHADSALHAAPHQQRSGQPVPHAQPAARGSRLWPRHRINGGAPADPFPAGPVLPSSGPSRCEERVPLCSVQFKESVSISQLPKTLTETMHCRFLEQPLPAAQADEPFIGRLAGGGDAARFPVHGLHSQRAVEAAAPRALGGGDGKARVEVKTRACTACQMELHSQPSAEGAVRGVIQARVWHPHRLLSSCERSWLPSCPVRAGRVVLSSPRTRRCSRERHSQRRRLPDAAMAGAAQ